MLSLDHLVIFKHKPELAEEDIDLIIREGGHHVNWGTYNYLAFMDDCYLEWIGIENDKVANESDNPLIEHIVYASQQTMEGPIQFALQTNNMDRIVENLVVNQIPFKGPFPGSRTKPDGTELKWRMLFPSYNLKEEVLPFLIEWEGEGNRANHAALVNEQSLKTISVGVKDLDQTASSWQNTYQFENKIKKITEKGKVYLFPLKTGVIELHEGEGLNAKFSEISF